MPDQGWTWGLAVNHARYSAIVVSDKGAIEYDIETGEKIRELNGPKGHYGLGVWLDSQQNLLWHTRESTILYVDHLSDGAEKPERVVELDIGKRIAGVCVDEDRGRLVVACADGDLMVLGGGVPRVKSSAKRS
jgi:hypothetical protein